MAKEYYEGSGKLTKIGTSLLNLEDIALYLNKAMNFITRADKATDVENVGGTKAEYIALADTTEFDAGRAASVDRNTVYNATHLGGQPVENFFSVKNGGKIVERQDEFERINGQEVIELKDELYQLRAELAKKGVIDSYIPYSGFYDGFRTSDKRHTDNIVGYTLAKAAGSPRLSIVVPSNLYATTVVGDHLSLKNQDGNECIVTIKEKDEDGRTLHLLNEASFEVDKDTAIYRSKGTVMNGVYAFGMAANTSIDKNQTMYTGFSDDTYSKFLRLDKNNPGYGYCIRIPRQMQNNYLSKIDIVVRAHNNPGALTCYLINERNVEKWNEAIRNGGNTNDGEPIESLIVAKSQPLVVAPDLDDHIVSFDFYDSTKDSHEAYGLSNPDCYPCLVGDDSSGIPLRYCMIIEADPETMDDSNYYEVEFLTSVTNGDLQVNNTTYTYNKNTRTPLATNEKINQNDLYYGITLLKAVQKDFVPYADGLYTAAWKEPEPVRSSYARLMLRVNREGMFTVAEGLAGNHVDGCTLNVSAQEAYGDAPLSNAKTVVIGTDIRKVTNADHLALTLEKGLYTDEKAPVYPIGYQVAIRASKEIWDPEKCAVVREYMDRYEMPLTCVMPDKKPDGSRISDRLIFEAPLNLTDGDSTLPREYNKFELEIYWKKSCANNLIEQVDKKYGTTAYVLAGSIKDLSLTLDRFRR